MTSEQRSASNRIGGLYRASKGGMDALGRAGAEKRLQNLENTIDPHGSLPPHERRRQAESLRKAQNTQAARKRWAKVRADSKASS